MSSNSLQVGLTEEDDQRCKEFAAGKTHPNALLPQDPADKPTEDLSFNTDQRNVTPPGCVLARRLYADSDTDVSRSELAERAGVTDGTMRRHLNGHCSHDHSEPDVKAVKQG